MALLCADVWLRNYSLSHSLRSLNYAELAHVMTVKSELHFDRSVWFNPINQSIFVLWEACQCASQHMYEVQQSEHMNITIKTTKYRVHVNKFPFPNTLPCDITVSGGRLSSDWLLGKFTHRNWTKIISRSRWNDRRSKNSKESRSTAAYCASTMRNCVLPTWCCQPLALRRRQQR